MIAFSLAIMIVLLSAWHIVCQNPKSSKSLSCLDSYHDGRERSSRLLESIPLQERLELDALFRWLFLREGFAYTLFGERAIAFTTFSETTYALDVIFTRREPPIFSWWKTWEKYKHLFPMKSFALITTQDDVHNCNRLYLINKKLYDSVIQEAQPNSKWVLNSGKTLEELERIFKEFKIEELPNYSEVLGILLGFGENNSYLFYRRDVLEQLIFPQGLSYENTSIAENVLKLSEELNQINNSLQGVQTHKKTKGLTPLSPLYFAGDPNTEETKQLLRKYQKSRDKISQGYSQGNFLEVTLERLSA